MRKLAYLFIILFFTLNFSSYGQSHKILIHLYKNCKEVNDFKFYYAKKDSKAYLLKSENNILIVPDSIKSEAIPLLLVTKKEKILFPIYLFKETKNISVYSNNIFVTSCIKQYKTSFFRKFFKKKYYIITDAMYDVTMVYRPTRNYMLIE